MKKYVDSCITLWFVTVVSFGIIHMAPGDMLSTLALSPHVSAEFIQDLKVRFGLDQPLVLQYVHWLKNFFLGDWGYSFVYQQEVFHLMLSRLGQTLLLMGSSLILSWLVVIPMALWAARYRKGWVDRIASMLSLSSLAMPVFVLAILALLLVSQTATWPLSGTVRLDYDFLPWYRQLGDRVQHLLVPCLVLSFVSVGGGFRVMRACVEEQLQAPYVLALRARGLSEIQILFKHVLRHVLNPVITLVGLQLPSLLSGAAFVEIIFAWPGLGSLMLKAVMHQDLFVVMANLVLSAILLVLGTTLSDWGLKWLDPRIR